MSAPSLLNLMHTLAEFQKLDKEMQAQTMQIFLLVALREGMTFRDIEQRTGYAPSTVSRNIALLGQTHRKGKDGHDLVVTKPDPQDLRSKRIHLTAKGKRMVSILAQRLEGDLT